MSKTISWPAVGLIMLQLLLAGANAFAQGTLGGQQAALPEGYWDRKEIPAWSPCNYFNAPFSAAVVGTTDLKKSEARARKLLAKFGEILPSTACPRSYSFYASVLPAGFQVKVSTGTPYKASFKLFIPEEALAEIQKEVVKLGVLEHWNIQKTGTETRPKSATDLALEKWGALTKEMNEHGDLLELTPHVRSLVKAEIERLGKSAVPSKALNGKIPFGLTLYTGTKRDSLSDYRLTR